MKALIVVDVQNDFLTGGALAVPDGDQVIPVINKLMEEFDWIIATQDWHPAGHGSFASSHQRNQPGDLIDLNGLQQILWPDHCVQNNKGAEFSDELNTDAIIKVFVKGTDPGIDSYSGFYDNGHKKSTGLADYLTENGIQKLYITGLATDYCVKFTALDATQLGFDTYLIKDATRAVNIHQDVFDAAVKEMESAGIKIVESIDLFN
ncbi:bifunctional nicotinamidase/pyrazinamidase [Bacteroidota bacterium]